MSNRLRGGAFIAAVLILAAVVVAGFLLRFNRQQRAWRALPLVKVGARCADLGGLLARLPFDKLRGLDFAEKIARYAGKPSPLRLATGEVFEPVGVVCPYGFLKYPGRTGDAVGLGLADWVVYSFMPADVVRSRGFTYFETATVNDLESGLRVICESAVHVPTHRRVQRLDQTIPGMGSFGVRFVHSRLPENPLLVGARDRVDLPTCRVPTRYGDVLALEVKVDLPAPLEATMRIRGDGAVVQADQADGRPVEVGAWLRRRSEWDQRAPLEFAAPRAASMLQREARRPLVNAVGSGVTLALLAFGLAAAVSSGRRRRGEPSPARP